MARSKAIKISEEETDKKEQCGIGPFRPNGLQRCARLIFFTLTVSLAGLFSFMQGPLLISQVTSIERQFSMTSTQTGALISANDIGFLLLVLVVSHFAKNSHGPRILSLASFVFGVAAFCIAFLNFAEPRSLKDIENNSQKTSTAQNKYLCLPSLHNQTSEEGCAEGDAGSSVGTAPVVALIGLFLALQGATKATRTPVGITYIDNNVPHRSKTGLHVGIVLTLVLFGPPLGFALGGVISSIPVDLSDTSISLQDPRWIGAWWIGFLVSGTLTLLTSIPMVFFPRRMPSARRRNDDSNTDSEEEATLSHVEVNVEGGEVSKEGKHSSSETEKPRDLKADDILTDVAKDDVKVEEQQKQMGLSNNGDVQTATTKGKDVNGDVQTATTKGKDVNGDVQTATTKGKDVNGDVQTATTKGKDVNGDVQTATTKGKDVNGDVQTATTKGKDVNGDAGQTMSDSEKGAETFRSMLKELPKSLLRLFRNPLYVIMLMAHGVFIFAVVGFSSFLIKFVEQQFGLLPSQSSFIFGLSNLVFSGLGTFTGGVLVSRYNLTRRGCLRWVIFAGSVSTVLSAITMVLGCDPSPYVGLGQSNFVLDNGLNTCSCDDTQYLPVCDGNQTFLSPCHAGCTRTANTTHFQDCGLAATPDVMVGACSTGCHLMIPFIVVQVLASAFGTSTVTPMWVTLLRSVSEKDKTLGMGMLSFVMSLIGFVPGPIIYGAVIDRACLIWSSSCGNPGACSLYDVTKLRTSYIGLEVGGLAMTVCLFALALLVLTWQIRTGRTKDEKPVPEKTVEIDVDKQSGEEGGGKDKRGKGPAVFQMMRH